MHSPLPVVSLCFPVVFLVPQIDYRVLPNSAGLLSKFSAGGLLILYVTN